METFNHWRLIFSLSFVTALSGALAPGPLLVYTITKSIRNHKTGYFTGIAVICGHAVLELALVLLIFFGLSLVLKNTLIIRGISFFGSCFLLYLGITMVYEVFSKKINTDLFDKTADITTQKNNKNNIAANSSNKDQIKNSFINNPVLGGILVSMSNPYWWIWWASIGTAFLVHYHVSLESPSNIIAFYSGHEIADFVWYAPISFLAFFGKKWLNIKIYSTVLFLCGFFMAGFGIYLAFNSVFKI